MWGSGGRKRGAHAEDPQLHGGFWGEGTRGGAHFEHARHVRDAGRVEAQRLVEGRRVLPSRKQGVGAEVTRGRKLEQRRAQARRARRGTATGGRARAAERTQNMPFMFVTRDVSKLTGWLKAAATCRGRKQGIYDVGRGVQAGRRGSYRARGQQRAQGACTRTTRDCRGAVGAGHAR